MQMTRLDFGKLATELPGHVVERTQRSPTKFFAPCFWTLYIWRLASIKTVSLPGNGPVKQFLEILPRRKGVTKKKCALHKLF